MSGRVRNLDPVIETDQHHQPTCHGGADVGTENYLDGLREREHPGADETNDTATVTTLDDCTSEVTSSPWGGFRKSDFDSSVTAAIVADEPFCALSVATTLNRKAIQYRQDSTGEGAQQVIYCPASICPAPELVEFSKPRHFHAGGTRLEAEWIHRPYLLRG